MMGIRTVNSFNILSFTELINANDAKYPEVVRITDGGTTEHPAYHVLYFYNCAPLDLLQYDPTGL